MCNIIIVSTHIIIRKTQLQTQRSTDCYFYDQRIGKWLEEEIEYSSYERPIATTNKNG